MREQRCIIPVLSFDDPLMQTAVGTGEKLGSSPTLCRLERRANRADIVALNRVLVDQFIASYTEAPKELILDIDASDIPLHGDQEKAEFQAYYDHYCYLPLYVFCGKAIRLATPSALPLTPWPPRNSRRVRRRNADPSGGLGELRRQSAKSPNSTAIATTPATLYAQGIPNPGTANER